MWKYYNVFKTFWLKTLFKRLTVKVKHKNTQWGKLLKMYFKLVVKELNKKR